MNEKSRPALGLFFALAALALLGGAPLAAQPDEVVKLELAAGPPLVAGAEVERSVALVTVRFEADIAAVTRNSAGEVVAGSLSDAIQTRDRWTFRRDISSRDPNWLLVETDEEE